MPQLSHSSIIAYHQVQNFSVLLEFQNRISLVNEKERGNKFVYEKKDKEMKRMEESIYGTRHAIHRVCMNEHTMATLYMSLVTKRGRKIPEKGDEVS